jgi:aryl-alcohol dehydrogenase-like predicted oxidoreductase
MKYTNLGRTGLRVSRICLGCMSYGTPTWRPWVLDEESSQPFFRRAVELGINFFDTADMYSLGVSEEVTGRALRRYARMDEVVLATKVYFPMGDGQNLRGLSRKHIVQGCEASLKRLGVEAIDLYQIHRMDPNTPLEETLVALRLHAGPLQPGLPRGGAGDAAPVRVGGHRRHPLVPAGARTARGLAKVAGRPRVHGPREGGHLLLAAL